MFFFVVVVAAMIPFYVSRFKCLPLASCLWSFEKIFHCFTYTDQCIVWRRPSVFMSCFVEIATKARLSLATIMTAVQSFGSLLSAFGRRIYLDCKNSRKNPNLWSHYFGSSSIVCVCVCALGFFFCKWSKVTWHTFIRNRNRFFFFFGWKNASSQNPIKMLERWTLLSSFESKSQVKLPSILREWRHSKEKKERKTKRAKKKSKP